MEPRHFGSDPVYNRTEGVGDTTALCYQMGLSYLKSVKMSPYRPFLLSSKGNGANATTGRIVESTEKIKGIVHNA